MTHKTRSDVHAYDILLTRLDVRGKKMMFEVPHTSWPELTQNVQDFNESMRPANITSDDTDRVQKHWKWSGRERRYYLEWMPVYEFSPFPYRWNFSTRSSIIPHDEWKAVRGRCMDQIPPLPSSFKSRFHKATVRRIMLQRLMLVERDIGSNFSGIYREWFDKISNRDERGSFLESLECLELNDFWVGFSPWAADTPLKEGNREDFRNKHWSFWYDELGMMSVRERAGIIEYPDLADRALEPPDNFKRLVSSESLPKDMEIALMQAWPSFRRNWPQTARCTVFSLHDAGEALTKIEEWMKTGSDTERVLLEDSSRSSLQEWLVGLIDL